MTSMDASPARVSLRVPLLVCALLAALTVPFMNVPSYDPMAWLIWGRQLTEGFISTSGGPSWKPLPVLFTTPFTALGDTAGVWLWMWVARFGGLASIVVAYALARRLGGRTEALVAAAALALGVGYLHNSTHGGSEGLLVAATFASAIALVDGRVRLGLLWAFVAALMRPEVAPLLIAIGLWMLRRPRASDLVLLATLAALLVAAWFIPERLGSGDGLRAANRALYPVGDSPAQSAFPFGMTFVEASRFLVWPIYVGAVAAVWWAWRRVRETGLRSASRTDLATLAIAAGAIVAMLEVAVGAEIGFTGKLRYATLPASLVAILGGLGLPRVVRELRARRQTLVLGVGGALTVVALGYAVWHMADGYERLYREDREYGRDLRALIERAGGERAIRRCAPVASSPYARQNVAWELHMDPNDVDVTEAQRGTLLALGASNILSESDLPLRDRFAAWQRRSDC